jgi:hypothetical protein
VALPVVHRNFLAPIPSDRSVYPTHRPKMNNTASTALATSQDPRTTIDFTNWLDQERTSSGIPENLWKANITTDDGWELLETLVPDLWDKQRQQTYVNAATARTAKKYTSITDNGAWVAIGWQPPGIEPVPIVKPKCPRWDKLGQKFIKYETPKGSHPMVMALTLPSTRAKRNLKLTKSALEYAMLTRLTWVSGTGRSKETGQSPLLKALRNRWLSTPMESYRSACAVSPNGGYPEPIALAFP